MGQRIGATGIGLQAPAYLYPTQVNNAGYDISNAYQALYPGQSLVVPAGNWYIQGGAYCVEQYLDPINGIWRGLTSVRERLGYVTSDGFNRRIANLTGCPVTAVVVAGGSGYPRLTTTVTADGSGGSTWQAIVGGMLSVSTINNAGSGYGIPPLLLISEPGNPGVQATGYCVLQSGTVATVTLANVGAGYITAPTAVVVPSPFDPNFLAGSTIVPATVTLAVVGSGSIAAVLCTNNGNSVSAVPTLTVAGTGGSGATVAAILMTTFSSATVTSSIGGGFASGAGLWSIGGRPSTTSWVTNPAIDGTTFIPRPVMATLAGGSSSLTSVSVVYDSGLFLGTPTLIVSAAGGTQGAFGTTATVTATYAGVADGILLQPAP